MTNYEKLELNRKELMDEIIKKIESKELTFRELWDNENSRPKNPLSGSKYNGSNRLRLGYQAVKNNYKDPRWVTYIQAKKEGWNLKKESKGTYCEKWIFTKEEKFKDEAGNVIKNIIKIKPFPNSFHLFNGEQFENIPKYIPESINSNSSDKKTTKILNSLIKSSECEVKIVAHDRAYYMPFEDIIALPLLENFYNNDNAIGTLLHEMAHSTGHKDRLDRENNFSKENYAREELVAEISAIFLEQDLGLNLNTDRLDNHSAYLKSWLKVFKEDYNELFKAVIEAEKSSNRILEQYNIQLEKEKLVLKEIIEEAKIKLNISEILYAEKHENNNFKSIVYEKERNVGEKLIYKNLYSEDGMLKVEEIFKKLEIETEIGILLGKNYYSKENKVEREVKYKDGEITSDKNYIEKTKNKKILSNER
ncbi:DUF1738 domain-containing protein [Cetobacterium sp. 2A]|uniref:ArdC family protein n=1 Tax=Cetobacterium sp. 2A TaxID=2754723 RepID=UPI00163CA579|nr:zincin-like metallopeptidase domain-containing protein [Cetobacterium sp. 2A]MBC2857032.1 DUF1738 domain-containing protein [Cetobacterium sp. 2A]